MLILFFPKFFFRYPSTESKPSANTKCQKCLETGHWVIISVFSILNNDLNLFLIFQTYECKNTPTYKARPTRTQQLTKPLKPISLELPDEFRSK